MSNMCKSLAKKVNEPTLTFPTSMYNTPIGSIIVSAYILSKNKEQYDINSIKKLWFKIEKNPLKYIKYGLDDEHFIDKTLDLFGLKRPKEFPIAMVMSKFNMLFVPYIDGEIYPIRDDGFMTQTLQTGKIYPINFNKTENKKV